MRDTKNMVGKYMGTFGRLWSAGGSRWTASFIEGN